MNRAVIKWVFVLVLLGVTFSAYVYAARKGPYFCDGCALATPVPDTRTLSALNDATPLAGLLWWNVGDTYIICNSSACAEYEVTSTFDFYADEPPVEREPGESGGGGGGNVGGIGGAGSNPFEDCDVDVVSGQVCTDGVCYPSGSESIVDCSFG